MCSFAESNVNSRNGMCWCFEEISLMILVQRILMYVWYRLLLKMFPRLSVLPSCHDCTSGPRRSLPCGQLADEYWKASHFSRTLQQTVESCYDKPHRQSFAPMNFCNHNPLEVEASKYVYDHFELKEEEEDDQFQLDCSDLSQLYQSTFLEDYDEFFLPEDIAWDVPVPEPNRKQQHTEEEQFHLIDDYYIDDDLEDHLSASMYQMCPLMTSMEEMQ